MSNEMKKKYKIYHTFFMLKSNKWIQTYFMNIKWNEKKQKINHTFFMFKSNKLIQTNFINIKWNEKKQKKINHTFLCSNQTNEYKPTLLISNEMKKKTKKKSYFFYVQIKQMNTNLLY
jgi:hypothetical protein